MDLRSIAESKFADELGEIYKSLYRKTHGVQPVLGDDDRATFNWLASKFPTNQAQSIVEGLFILQVRYVIESMHPTSAIRKHLNACLAVGSKKKPSLDSTSTQQLVCDVKCDRCGDGFLWKGKKEAFQTAAFLCSKCQILPTPSLADFETKVADVQDLVLSNELQELVRKAISGNIGDREFGSFCGAQISRKLRGDLNHVNWKAYSDAVYLAGYLIHDAKK